VRLSDDKVRHLTHVVLKGLLEKKLITPKIEESEIRKDIRRVINRELKIADTIDETVRRKLQSYSRKIYEGSPEWDVLYNKFFEEETAKKGRG
jgi:hypothetical protein